MAQFGTGAGKSACSIGKRLDHEVTGCLVNLGVPKNYLESMSKHRFPDSIPRDANVIGKAQVFALLSSSQVTLGYTWHSAIYYLSKSQKLGSTPPHLKI